MPRKRNRPAKPQILDSNRAYANKCLERAHRMILTLGTENERCTNEAESVVNALSAEKILKTVRRVRWRIQHGENLLR